MKTVKTSVYRSFSFRKSGGNYYICYYVDFEGVRIPLSPQKGT